MVDLHAAHQTLQALVRHLLDRRTPAGHWEGHLASSALSTATAVAALSFAGQRRGQQCPEIQCGLDWLARHQNADGGWGDTILSMSNTSTTSLCWAAISISEAGDQLAAPKQAAERWLRTAAGTLDPATLADVIRRRYGKDHTFAVPILTVLAVAGKLGPPATAWPLVPQLPFELAAFPHSWFRWLRLPVVSYALPALIAMGQARHRHAKTWNPVTRLFRDATRARTLQVLEKIQPAGGGFLEAVPLTCFVVLSLVAAGQEQHPVVREGVRFLLRTVRSDGSWPIDTNLATWVTTLSVNALAKLENSSEILPLQERHRIQEWLLSQQHLEQHPYTGAAPGGWAWTDLPGGVPDADDTAGALVALKSLGAEDPRVRTAAKAGVSWLLDLQNRDGGIPTFCRGWGHLPFDRSGADLTAHTLKAWSQWFGGMPEALQTRISRAIRAAVGYLQRTQGKDGSWEPLWFGNQHAPAEENLTYGTARVVIALAQDSLRELAQGNGMLDRGAQWLLRTQNPDGGWGGVGHPPASIEETALAVDALGAYAAQRTAHEPHILAAIDRGVNWLVETARCGSDVTPAPIGLYFARLWYFEELYPLIFATGALARALPLLTSSPKPTLS